MFYKNIFFGISLLLVSVGLSAQENKKENRKESRHFMQLAEESLAKNNFALAEANYRQAVALDTTNAKASYNMGTLYYKKQKTADASGRLADAGNTAEIGGLKHKAFHNQGNAFMEQKNYQAAVEAYKNALRNDPTDDETRYNFALAKKMLEKEQKQQKEQKDQNKDKKEKEKGKEEQKKDQQNKKENKGQKDKNQGDKQQDEQGKPNEDKPGEQKQNQQQQPDAGNKEKQPDAPKPVKGELSPQQVKNLLEAMQNQERQIQKKINAEKAKGQRVQTEKDW